MQSREFQEENWALLRKKEEGNAHRFVHPDKQSKALNRPVHTDQDVPFFTSGSRTVQTFLKGPRLSSIRHLNQPTSLSEGVSAKSLPVGARLAPFEETRAGEVEDAWILQIIRRLKFSKKAPHTAFGETRMPSCPRKWQCLRTYIVELLKVHAILRVPEAECGEGIYSPLFLVAKSSGAFRPVLDLMFLISFIGVPPLKMESLETIILVVKPGD